MAYRKSVYIKAKSALDERRRKAEHEQENRHSAAVAICPKIAEIEREMAGYAAEVIRSVSLGGGTEDFVLALSQKNLEAQARLAEELESAGLPKDYLETNYTCKNCNDTGSHGGYYCKCYLDLIKQTAKDELEVAYGLRNCGFNNFDTSLYPNEIDPDLGISAQALAKGTLNYCKKYAREFSKNSSSLLMAGKTGLGKTHLSLAIANAVIDRGFAVYYSSVHSIMNRLEREQFSRQAPDEALSEQLYESDLLIIDDLGSEFSTQFTVAALYNIINTRINRGKPIIISTNLTMSELEERYSQRVTSRIIGCFEQLLLIGSDVRQILAMRK